MFTPKKVFDICRKKGTLCWYCGGGANTLDHLKPRHKGGTNEDNNLVPTCGACNIRKRAFDLETFRQIEIRRIYKIPYFKKEQIKFLKEQGFVFEKYQYKFYYEKQKL